MQPIEATYKYRVDTEEEAVNLIDQTKQRQASGGYEVTKSGYVLKTKKQKGVIIEAWYIVTITLNYDLGE